MPPSPGARLRRAPALALALACAALAPGCAHRVQILSSPTGASVYRDGERIGTTPEFIEIRPLQRARLSVSLPGYRTLTFHPDLRTRLWDFAREALTLRWAVATGRVTYATMEIVLVPEHPTYGGLATPDPDVGSPLTDP